MRKYLLKSSECIGYMTCQGVKVETSGTPIFVQYVREIIANNGIKKFISLDVWSEEFSKDLGISDPRPLGWKMIHTYLRLSRKYSNTIVVRGIDHVLKKIV